MSLFKNYILNVQTKKQTPSVLLGFVFIDLSLQYYRYKIKKTNKKTPKCSAWKHYVPTK